MDKYPELEEDFQSAPAQGDFLSRERELLGDDAAEFAADGISAETEAEADFESAYPALDEEVTVEVDGQTSEGPSEPETVASTPVPERGESEFVREWRARNELELERRDAASAEKLAETRQKAEKAIDDFYENYNQKKSTALEEVRRAAEAFVTERDAGNTGTTWDRVAELIAEAPKPAGGVRPADKSRFKEIVDSLKGDPNAPGAAGY